jgi:hypothetical protein
MAVGMQVADVARIAQVRVVLAQVHQAEGGQQPIEQHHDEQHREDGRRKTEDDGQELGHLTPFALLSMDAQPCGRS